MAIANQVSPSWIELDIKDYQHRPVACNSFGNVRGLSKPTHLPFVLVSEIVWSLVWSPAHWCMLKALILPSYVKWLPHAFQFHSTQSPLHAHMDCIMFTGFEYLVILFWNTKSRLTFGHWVLHAKFHIRYKIFFSIFWSHKIVVLCGFEFF